jgi:hypothetical protein
MPLRSTGDPGEPAFSTSTVEFEMCDDKDARRVRCSISDGALRQFDPRMELNKEACLTVFSAHRQAIEDLASRKYDRGRIDDDGKVRVNEEDVPPRA